MVAITRNSNPLIFIPPIAFGALFAVGTIIAAIFLKPGIEDRMKKPLPVENLSRGMEVDTIDRQIKSIDEQIKTEQTKPDLQKQLSDARRKLDEASRKKSAQDTSPSTFEQEKAATTKRLEDQKVALDSKKRALQEQMQNAYPKKRTWLEWAGDYDILTLVFFIFPLGVLSYYLVRVLISGRLPERNPFSLTAFERKSLLFFILSIIGSTFGFLLFVWILTVRSNFS